MKIDLQYLSFCKEIGLFKEQISRETALQQLIKAVKDTKAADPEFAEVVSKLTLESKEIAMRACILYHYDLDVDFVINGSIKSTRISDFASTSGSPSGLRITQYSGNGTYATLTDPASIPYPIFNSQNLFTYEGMKGALTEVIEKSLPKYCTSFQSKNWSVSAFLVPVLVLFVPFKGKEYQLCYNLQNGYSVLNYPDNPALLKKGDTAKRINIFGKIGCLLLSALAVFFAIKMRGHVFSIITTIAILIAQIVIAIKTKKERQEYRSQFLKNPQKGIASCLIFVFLMGALAIASLVLAFIL
ncbi:MAG: hypothetical protein E7680_05400 [Ruminococcaceae bacterium]|nr:hypothetical protein [Oscillospiraceae bacterium]